MRLKDIVIAKYYLSFKKVFAHKKKIVDNKSKDIYIFTTLKLIDETLDNKIKCQQRKREAHKS